MIRPKVVGFVSTVLFELMRGGVQSVLPKPNEVVFVLLVIVRLSSLYTPTSKYGNVVCQQYANKPECMSLKYILHSYRLMKQSITGLPESSTRSKNTDKPEYGSNHT